MKTEVIKDANGRDIQLFYDESKPFFYYNPVENAYVGIYPDGTRKTMTEEEALAESKAVDC